MNETPIVLDACCGSRMFWFNKFDCRSIFIDKRIERFVIDKGTHATIGRKDVVVSPNIIADFTSLPFKDNSFYHIVFDPPHYTKKSLRSTGILAHKYGVLVAGWEEHLRGGFSECFRVLKPHGTLIFKWCSTEIPLAKVLSLTDITLLYGHKTGKRQATYWVAFIKQGLATCKGPKEENKKEVVP